MDAPIIKKFINVRRISDAYRSLYTNNFWIADYKC